MECECYGGNKISFALLSMAVFVDGLCVNLDFGRPKVVGGFVR